MAQAPHPYILSSYLHKWIHFCRGFPSPILSNGSHGWCSLSEDDFTYENYKTLKLPFKMGHQNQKFRKLLEKTLEKYGLIYKWIYHPFVIANCDFFWICFYKKPQKPQRFPIDSPSGSCPLWLKTSLNRPRFYDLRNESNPIIETHLNPNVLRVKRLNQSKL